MTGKRRYLGFAPDVPPPPFERDAARWADFCATVVDRIAAIRAEEGHTGGAWCAFWAPLPECIDVRSLPIGAVTPGPPPRLSPLEVTL